MDQLVDLLLLVLKFIFSFSLSTLISFQPDQANLAGCVSAMILVSTILRAAGILTSALLVVVAAFIGSVGLFYIAPGLGNLMATAPIAFSFGAPLAILGWRSITQK